MANTRFIRIGFITLTFTLVLLTLLHSSSHIKQTSSETKVKREYVPGAYVAEQFPSPTNSNESFCDFNYKLPKDLRYLQSDINFGPELGKSARYRIIYNAVQARINGEVPAITYATHVTADFMNYIPELLR